MDPVEFLESEDHLRVSVMQAISREVLELRAIEQHNLAVKIAEQVGKLFRAS